jgi:hypothetical protein
MALKNFMTSSMVGLSKKMWVHGRVETPGYKHTTPGGVD